MIRLDSFAMSSPASAIQFASPRKRSSSKTEENYNPIHQTLYSQLNPNASTHSVGNVNGSSAALKITTDFELPPSNICSMEISPVVSYAGSSLLNSNSSASSTTSSATSLSIEPDSVSHNKLEATTSNSSSEYEYELDSHSHSHSSSFSSSSSNSSNLKEIKTNHSQTLLDTSDNKHLNKKALQQSNPVLSNKKHLLTGNESLSFSSSSLSSSSQSAPTNAHTHTPSHGNQFTKIQKFVHIVKLVSPEEPNEYLKILSIPISPDSLKVGRQNTPKTSNKITDGFFDSRVLSRNHAELFVNNNHLFIRDLKSSNGTFINDLKLEPYKDYPLKIGDKIDLGTTLESQMAHKKITCIIKEFDFISLSNYEGLVEEILNRDNLAIKKLELFSNTFDALLFGEVVNDVILNDKNDLTNDNFLFNLLRQEEEDKDKGKIDSVSVSGHPNINEISGDLKFTSGIDLKPSISMQDLVKKLIVAVNNEFIQHEKLRHIDRFFKNYNNALAGQDQKIFKLYQNLLHSENNGKDKLSELETESNSKSKSKSKSKSTLESEFDNGKKINKETKADIDIEIDTATENKNKKFFKEKAHLEDKIHKIKLELELARNHLTSAHEREKLAKILIDKQEKEIKNLKVKISNSDLKVNDLTKKISILELERKNDKNLNLEIENKWKNKIEKISNDFSVEREELKLKILSKNKEDDLKNKEIKFFKNKLDQGTKEINLINLEKDKIFNSLSSLQNNFDKLSIENNNNVNNLNQLKEINDKLTSDNELLFKDSKSIKSELERLLSKGQGQNQGQGHLAATTSESATNDPHLKSGVETTVAAGGVIFIACMIAYYVLPTA